MSQKPDLAIPADAIDPSEVPVKILNTGDKMPGIGLGTFGSDHADAGTIAKMVKEALLLGYRHIDCAAVYGNEAEIGSALDEVFASGLVKREEVWITSKVWNDHHGKGDVILSCARSLRDLRLDYLDLFLVHWPFPNFHPPGCSVDSRSPDAVGYIHENFMKTWEQMERLKDMGMVRNIGTSNMTIPKLKRLLKDCRIKPAANELELHPHFQQSGLFDFLVENKIQPIGFSPIGSPGRPDRDRTEEDTVDMEDPVIQKIATDHSIHPALVCLKWASQRGQVPIPFSTKRRNVLSNITSVITDPLSEEEMSAIARIDKNCRLIKGQVFLWKEGQSWEDLWDLSGEITPL